MSVAPADRVPPGLVEPRHAIGVMMGTSLDGIDAALVTATGRANDLRVTLRAHAAQPLGPLAETLRAVAEQRPHAAGTLAQLAVSVGERQIAAIERVWPRDGLVDVIVLHGQTVAHAPPASWQLVEPAAVVARFDVPVLTDLRQPDLAAGGQGAPITPRADWVLFAGDDRRRAVVNLGGFCNVTVLPRRVDGADAIEGFDVCVCNQLLDRIARETLGMAYDEAGARAAEGTVAPAAEAALVRELTVHAAARRSLGPGDEATAWLDDQRRTLAPADLAATAAAGIGAVIAGRLAPYAVDDVVLAGGGARHAPLRQAIARGSEAQIVTSEAHGVPVDAREAMAMATLGLLALDGADTTLPAVTGRAGPLAGAGRWSLPAWAAPIRSRRADAASLRGDA